MAQRQLSAKEISVAVAGAVPSQVAAVYLVHRILRDQQLLLDRDPSLRIRFEVAARNRYFDLKPFLDRYRKPRTSFQMIASASPARPGSSSRC